MTGNSLFIFSSKNPLRVILSRIVVTNIFEMLIFSLVLISAILMVLEDPLEDPTLEKFAVIKKINDVITYMFVGELLIKLIVFGLYFNGRDSYLKNGWNILDGIIVIFSVVSMVIEEMGGDNNATKGFQLMKMLRVLRSLRLISKNEGLKLSVLSLIYSLPGIANVTVVSALFLLLLGIFFLNILKGKFWYCDNH